RVRGLAPADRHDERIRLRAVGAANTSVPRAGHLVPEDAVARGAYRGAAGDVSGCADRVGTPRPVQVRRILLAVELLVPRSSGRRYQCRRNGAECVAPAASTHHPAAADTPP